MTEVKTYAWQDVPESEWEYLIVMIDPDWTDHFKAPEHGLGFYNYSEDGQLSTTQEAVKEFWDDYDPTPYCAGCGAMNASGCDCGPIAENE
jgi:hypothetical protein